MVWNIFDRGRGSSLTEPLVRTAHPRIVVIAQTHVRGGAECAVRLGQQGGGEPDVHHAIKDALDPQHLLCPEGMLRAT